MRACLRTPEDYYRIAYECFEDLAAQHVLYAEINFSPRLPDRPRYLPQDEMMAAIDQARRDVEARTPFRAGLLLGLPRDPQGVDPVLLEAVTCQFVESALEAREKGVRVVGMDLHGDEQTAPDVGPFVAAYRLARQAGLGVRAHAGEGGGPAVVRESLDRLHVQRVAHGVRATEDPALVQRLAAEGVVLDICPTSNVLTGTVASLEQHPIRALEQAGVIVTVSSDDPLVFDTTVTTELALLQLTLGYAREELGRLSTQAAEHSFLPDAERSTLAEAVRAGWR
jgi:adenosine deaminase